MAKPKKTNQEPTGKEEYVSTDDGQTARPMAAPEPDIKDRIAALELANIELERRMVKMDTFILRVARDHSYQYSGST